MNFTNILDNKYKYETDVMNLVGKNQSLSQQTYLVSRAVIITGLSTKLLYDSNTTSPISSHRTYKWDKLRCGRHALGYKEHEDGERQQDRDTERHLLPGVSRKPEPEQAQNGQPQARKYDVEQVVESAPAHHYRERHIRVRLDAASVSDLIPFDADVE